MKPFLDDLTKRGISYQYQPHVASNYYDHYNFYFGPSPRMGRLCPFSPAAASSPAR